MRVIIYLSPKCLKRVEKVKKTDFFKKQGFRQSWRKVLGIVLQYSYFLLFLGSLFKQCSVFEIFLQFSLPPPYTKLKHCFWGEGRGWTCVNWKTPQKCKSVPRLLFMIVGLTMGTVRFSLYLLLLSCVYRSNAHESLPTDVPPALIQTTVT